MSSSIDSEQQGAGDDRAQFEAWARDKYELHRNGGADYSANFTRCAWSAWQSASQTYGQIVAWYWPSTGVVCSAEAVSRDRAPTDNAMPLYTAPPTPAVDLEQFRRPLKVARSAMEWARNEDAAAECDRLLALIDQQAGKGGA